ncbi:protein-glutamate methylesterase/protein-glutamine glutaminase [Mesobacillus harenae]|uniref:protein-glutamate methylesterase/protein-glutamine glutaminase n=1 Tax=Mesobacillus harenae TaxID=2213203 RepID=UPI001580AB6A|nr:chemotaxis response regulator protein-glutamate methylesterase [Mesobacillus harenae]
MEKIKVLIADDSAFMRKLLQELLSADPRIEVVGTARNGEDAFLKIKKLNPDVVTLDVEMPILNGFEALKLIMEEHPVPVVMVSSATAKGAEATLQAIQAGAFDFVAKPSGTISLDLHKIKDDLIGKVILAKTANLNKKLVQARPMLALESENQESRIEQISGQNILFSEKKARLTGKRLVCIGCSTGGPRVLHKVLAGLPKSLSAPVLVVQHMPPGFTRTLANRLNSFCEITVKEAEQGETLQNGTVYIAPGGFHMEAVPSAGGVSIHLTNAPARNGHRPSVDVLYESVSKLKGYSKVAVIMTGMGTDGAKGLVLLNQSGNLRVIAESEETSVIFGMPKAAIATGFVDSVSNNENIAKDIAKYI